MNNLREVFQKYAAVVFFDTETSGLDENDAVYDFEELISDAAGPVLLAAHNAQFDLQFVGTMADRYAQPCSDYLLRADYLDTLTVYKDRRAYPHKLANAIVAYKLQDKVKNSHRYNPKYGVSGRRLSKVSYWPQRFNNYMQAPAYTLPALNKRR